LVEFLILPVEFQVLVLPVEFRILPVELGILSSTGRTCNSKFYW